MLVTESEVKEAVEGAFQGATTELRKGPPDRIWGYIIWKEFSGQAPEERLRQVEEKVRSRFGRRGINLGVLIPVTPKEAKKRLLV
jgi:hypothetical protein